MTHRILITGAGGMVGCNITNHLLANGFDVMPTYYGITIPHNDDNNIRKILNTFEFCDVLSEEQLDSFVRDYQPTIIIHLAAQSRPDVSFNRPFDTIKTNVSGTLNIVKSEWVSKNLPWIINFSSSAVYGDIDWKVPVSENAPTRPSAPYGVSKLAAELALDTIYPGRLTSIRLFNCSGPLKTSDLISDIAKRITCESSTRIQVGDLSTKRHYLHVEDVCAAVLSLIRANESNNNSIYKTFNIAPSHQNVSTGFDVVDSFSHILGYKLETSINDALMRPKDEKVIWGSSANFTASTGWRSSKNLSDIISDTLNYYRAISRSADY